ncbi:phytanoyl-CoA dioxygenase family protein [Trichodesmium erythraeum]|uniref:phytanoyl-CoA dioxygenase family protein n=1 Tax=Trichodesmium erythraeum TaxID=1206 RepID=UPI00003C9EF2
MEEDGKTLRAIHEVPSKMGVLEKISQHPKLVEPAMQILGSQVYVHQLKINFKAAFTEKVWPWHQDFIFWHKGRRNARTKSSKCCYLSRRSQPI